MKRTIIINLAIVPNTCGTMMLGWDTPTLKACREYQIEGENVRFGLDSKPTDRAIEIWYGDEKEAWQNGGLPQEIIDLFPAEVGDWQNKCHQFDKYGNRLDILPSHLPARLFAGKREGDQVKLFESAEAIVYGELRQRQNRYARFGNFEDVYAAVTC